MILYDILKTVFSEEQDVQGRLDLVYVGFFGESGLQVDQLGTRLKKGDAAGDETWGSAALVGYRSPCHGLGETFAHLED